MLKYLILLFLFLISFVNSANVYKNLVVPAFGVSAQIGDIYDARTNQFIKINIFQSGIKFDFVKLVDNYFTKSGYESSATTYELLNSMNLEAEIKIKIMLKEIELAGVEGKFIKNSVYNIKNNFISVSYVLQMKTKRQYFDWNDKETTKFYDLSKIKLIGTHFVTEIEYGGNAFLTISEIFAFNSSITKNGARGKLQTFLQEAGISVDCKTEKNATSEFRGLKISVEADVEPKEGDDTSCISGAKAFMKSFFERVKHSNDGKGTILYYEMTPLSLIEGADPIHYFPLPNKMIKEINDCLNDIETISDKSAEALNELDDNKIYFTNKEIREWTTQHLHIETNISSIQKKLKKVFIFHDKNDTTHSTQILQNATAATLKLNEETKKYYKFCEKLLEKMDFIKFAEQKNFYYIYQERGFDNFTTNYPISLLWYFNSENYKNLNFRNNLINGVIEGKLRDTQVGFINADKLDWTKNLILLENGDNYPLFIHSNENYYKLIKAPNCYAVIPTVINTEITLKICTNNKNCTNHSVSHKNEKLPIKTNHTLVTKDDGAQITVEVYHEYEGSREFVTDLIFCLAKDHNKSEHVEIFLDISLNATLSIKIKSNYSDKIINKNVFYTSNPTTNKLLFDDDGYCICKMKNLWTECDKVKEGLFSKHVVSYY